MRIAFFTDTYLPERNGVAVSVGAIVAELARCGHAVLVIAPAEADRYVDDLPGVTVVRLPAVRAPFFADFRCIYRGFLHAQKIVRDFRPDVVHVHSIFMAGWIGRAAARRLRVPLVGTNHIAVAKGDTAFYRNIMGDGIIGRLGARLMLRYTYFFLRPLDVCVVPSQKLLGEMRDTGYRQPLVRIPNPVSLEHVPLPAARLPRANTGDRVLLHVGRLSHEKSIDIVIRAFAMLRKNGKQYTLEIVGGGPSRPDLEKIAAIEGVAEHVRFLGEMAHPDLMRSGLHAKADLFVTASRTESQGMAVLEAMAFGVPVVAVAEGAVPEMVGDGGLLVAADNPPQLAAAMERVLEDRALAAALAQAARERASSFSVAGACEAHLAAYASLVSKKP